MRRIDPSPLLEFRRDDEGAAHIFFSLLAGKGDLRDGVSGAFEQRCVYGDIELARYAPRHFFYLIEAPLFLPLSAKRHRHELDVGRTTSYIVAVAEIVGKREGEKREGARTAIAGFGSAFLLLVSLKYFFNDKKS